MSPIHFLAACRILFHLNVYKDIEVSQKSTETIHSLVTEALCECNLHVNDDEHDRISISNDTKDWGSLKTAGHISSSKLNSEKPVIIGKQHQHYKFNNYY